MSKECLQDLRTKFFKYLPITFIFVLIPYIVKKDILLSIQMSERTHSLLYIFPLSTPNKKRVSSQHILGHRINSWLWSWVAHPRHQLVKFHHVMLSRWAAMILRTGTRSFERCCWKGYHYLKYIQIEHKLVSFRTSDQYLWSF